MSNTGALERDIGALALAWLRENAPQIEPWQIEGLEEFSRRIILLVGKSLTLPAGWLEWGFYVSPETSSESPDVPDQQWVPALATFGTEDEIEIFLVGG